MSRALSFWMRLKTIRKGGAGLPPRRMRDALFTEYLGPNMHSKLNQAYRARKKRAVSL